MKRTPAWRRYWQSERTMTTSRAASPAPSTNRLSPSLSMVPSHTPRKTSATRACTSGSRERVTFDGADAERVDPPGAPVGRGDRVGPLVDHGDPEVLEQRHHVGEHERAPRPVELDARDATVGGRHEADLEVTRRIEPFQDREVADRGARAHVELVGGRERLHPAAEGVEPVLLPPYVDERVAEIVDPGSHEATQLGFERADVGGERAVRGGSPPRAGAPSPIR